MQVLSKNKQTKLKSVIRFLLCCVQCLGVNAGDKTCSIFSHIRVSVESLSCSVGVKRKQCLS